MPLTTQKGSNFIREFMSATWAFAKCEGWELFLLTVQLWNCRNYRLNGWEETGRQAERQTERQTKMPYPRVTITFCTKCKWNLRAAWYLQELLQTFGSQLGEVALIPGPSGCFEISTVSQDNTEPVLIWERVRDGGFPDSKVLKQKVRDVLYPGEKLGHVDGTGGVLLQESKQAESSECVECKNP